MHQFTTLRIIGSLGLLAALAGGTVACGATSDVAPATDTKAWTNEAACPQEAEQKDELQGKGKLVGEALSRLCLSEDQRQGVEQLGSQVAFQALQVEMANQAFMTALAIQIQTGQIIRAALAAQIEAVVRAREAASLVLQQVLVNLHQILNAQQRLILVGVIQARSQELASASGAPQQEVQEEEAKAEPSYQALKSEAATPSQVAPLADVAEKAREGAEGMVTAAERFTPSMTPEQRADLAGQMQQKPAEEPQQQQQQQPQQQQQQPEQAGTSQQQHAMIVFGGFGTGFRAGGFGGWGGGWGGYRGFGYGLGFPGGFGLGVNPVGWGVGNPIGWGVGNPIGFGVNPVGWGVGNPIGFGVNPVGWGINRVGFGAGLGYGAGFGLAGWPSAFGMGFAGSPFFGAGFGMGTRFIGGAGRFLW